MKSKLSMETWLELERARINEDICVDCFRKTLKIVLDSKLLRELKNAIKIRT